jgi:L-asparaginase II
MYSYFHMTTTPYIPLLEITRGDVIESIHYGAAAVMDVHGHLVAWAGDPEAVTFLRSSSKPLQALAFIEHGGVETFDLQLREVALICASHSGTDDHVAVVESIQAKVGLHESDLQCGVQFPLDEATSQAMCQRGEEPTPNRHNCSGKHTGMLAYARQQGWPITNYLDLSHPVQQSILHTFAEMCDLPIEQVHTGIDGCSAPNFAVPLRNAALAFARLSDPEGGHVSPSQRRAACQTIQRAMTTYPEMVSGPGRFDTLLMQAAQGRLLAKGGAEGYQAIGLFPGAIRPGSPALGIVTKIADGDARGLARSAVALEVLRQLGALSTDALATLSSFGPQFPIYNWRKLLVGEGRTCFELNMNPS